jgi:hypothetical protein
MWVSNCWVESALHEAHAWSGGGRQAWTYDSVLINSGQGIECGWSTGDNSPLCFAERLLTTANGVGARVGDNYDWSYNGFLWLTNSLILHNYRDIFLKTWNGVGSGLNALSWEDRVSQVDFQSNLVTTVDARFPGNAPWDPVLHAGRLAHFMTTPAGAPVGVGLALRTNRLALASLFNGVPVRLSSFTTNMVRVSYAWVSGNTDLSSGRLTFLPGETVKHVFPHDFDLVTVTNLALELRDAEQAEITGLARVTAAGVVSRPQVSLAVVTNMLSAWRLTEGVFVQLSSPSALPVTLNYQFTGSNEVVQGGTVVLPPNTLRTRLFLTNALPFDYDFLELTVSEPGNATLAGITNVVYAHTTVPLRITLLSAGPLPLPQITNGVQITLNAPAGQGVSVDFSVVGNRTGATNGTLAFVPGAVSALLQAPTVPVADNDFVLVTLARPVKASLSSPAQVVYVRMPERPPLTNTLLIARGSNTVWRYYASSNAPPTNWHALTFNDSGWPTGRAELGYGDGDEVTVVPTNGQLTTYFRRSFMVAEPGVYTNLFLWLLRDDGGVVYVNGREVYRSPNVPAGPVGHTTTTVSGQNGENTVDTNVVSAGVLVAGTNVVAVSIHQAGATSSDMSFNFELWGIAAPRVPEPLPLYYGMGGEGLVLAWGDGEFRLLQATNVAGPWVTNSLPGWYRAGVTNPESYFRLVRP